MLEIKQGGGVYKTSSELLNVGIPHSAMGCVCGNRVVVVNLNMYEGVGRGGLHSAMGCVCVGTGLL